MRRIQILAATLLEGISPAKAQRRKGAKEEILETGGLPLRLCAFAGELHFS